MLALVLAIMISVQPHQVIEGRVLNASNGEPLSYVNIGVVGTRIGAVSDSAGYFELNAPAIKGAAVIRFSRVGFGHINFRFKELREQSKGSLIIEMQPLTIEMKELTIAGSRFKKRRKGTRSDNKLMVTGWGRNLVGGERGIRIKVDDNPLFLKQLNFHMVQNEFEEVLLRMNIREFKDDLPGSSLLKKDILITVTEKSGWVRYNLEEYNLVFDSDIVVSLQPVAHKGSCNESEVYCFVLSLSRMKWFSTSWFFYKWSAESEWQVMKNSSPGIYLDVLEDQ